MADEVIVLEVDETEAVRGAQRANQALALVERTGDRVSSAATAAATAQADRVVRVVERSRQSVDRLVANVERRASFAGKSGIERLEAERSQLLARIEGDERAINRVRAAYDKLLAVENAGSGGGGAGAILQKLRNPIESAGEAVDGFLARFGRVGAAAGIATAALSLFAKAGFDVVSSAGAQAETVNNLAERLGVTASQAYRLKIQAEGAGLSVEAFESAYRGLSAAIEDGTQEGRRGAEAINRLGVRVVETDGRVRNARDLFNDLGAALGRIENPAERARRVIEVFGRSGLSLLPLLTGFRDTEEAAKRAAAGINDPLLASLGRVDDKMDELGARWNTLKTILASKIVGVIEFVERNAPTGGLSASQGDSIPGILNAARGRGQIRRPQPVFGPETTPEERRQAESLLRAREAEAERIIESARRRRGATDEGLREQLAEATRQRQEAQGKLLPGLGPEEARSRVAALDTAVREENRLKAAIEARAKAQRDAEEFSRSRAQLTERLTIGPTGEPEFLRASREKALESVRAEGLRVLQLRADQERQADEFRRETESIRRATELGGAGVGIAQEEANRARQLQQLDAFNARTVTQKVDVENRKAAIEEDSVIRTFRLRADLLDAEARQEIDTFEVIARARGIQEEEIGARRAAILERYSQRAAEIEIRTSAEIEQIRGDAVRRSTELQLAEQERVFERFRSGFESLIDQLFSRARSVADVGRSLLAAFILTPLKQSAADLFAQIATGQARSGGQAGGLGGLFGGFLGRLGGGAGGGFIGPFGAGAPGGTPGFAGPVGAGAGGPVPSLAVRGGFGQFAAIGAAQRAGLLEFLGLGGSISTGAGAATTFGAATLSQKLSAIGKSNAALAAGGLLAFDGLRRGGALGLAETTAGGALIGFKFGGPLGAAIGAGAGAAAGFIRLFVKGAQEKIVEKVRALYGISISKEFARDPLLGIIKSQFGGNIDVGIRAPQVRDLIELYGMSTGAGNGPLGDRLRPLSFRDLGRGGLQEVPGFFNGVPRLTVSGGASSAPAPVVIQSVQLVVGEESAAAFMRGEIAPVVADSPSAVAAAMQTATKLSIGRRDAVAAQLGMVTA